MTIIQFYNEIIKMVNIVDIIEFKGLICRNKNLKDQLVMIK